MKRCEICGARVRNRNPKTTTCSPFCTEQKKTGLSRDELVRRDSQIPKTDDGYREYEYYEEED